MERTGEIPQGTAFWKEIVFKRHRGLIDKYMPEVKKAFEDVKYIVAELALLVK
jgi:hypothetical protein